MELKLEKITIPEVIQFNYDDLKKEITERTAKYVNLVYTDDQIKDAKKDVAMLRKFTKALSDERIRVKKDLLKPYEDFESKVKELTSIVDEGINNIDSQVKSFEEQKKEEKLEEILHCWNELCIFEWLNFKQVFDEKWLNASVKMAAVRNEIVAKMEQISADLVTLSNLPEFSFEAVEVYKQSIDINKAITEGKRLAEIQKMKEEAAASQTHEKEATEKATQSINETVATTETAQQKQEVCFRCWLSKEDAQALAEFFKSKNIKYSKIYTKERKRKMAVQNSLVAKQGARLGLTAYLTQDAVKDQINKVVGGKDGQRFISAIISATTTNPALQECSNQSILSGALLGESLKLSPSPQLGQYYLVPYNDKEKGKVAQFQLGYKGYIQLAIRSGQYKKMNVLAIKEGELIHFDPLNEEIEVKLIQDEETREQAATIGYYAMFEYTNGFKKALYWSKAKMESHALKYSPGYKKDREKGWSYTFWSKDFDGMAYKTMLRQLISKWGIMSIEMATAIDSDYAVINEDGTKNYVETESEAVVIDYVAEPEPQDKKTESSDNETNDAAAALFGE